MKECLGCWEEIEDDEVVCHHCGSNQEEIKDYLALVLLKQNKKKITVPEETPVLNYVFETDPTEKEEISISTTPSEPKQRSFFSPFRQQPRTQSEGTYKPENPSWLAKPSFPNETKTEKPKNSSLDDSILSELKTKTITCPKCSADVPLLKYCKSCGQKLLRNCPSCNKEIAVTAKFCTGCGMRIEPFLDKTKHD